eukprot:TRINITY_DN12327_c0_g1_i1.p1 TRINITY_DN12327_c0_g1~~TRINITY_DN12327_c0_g1_i1.p1  ORF type:complete len:1904 (+),score=216.40 TRINITY_DN12327_c0_g1_i1:3608-9319(+)
METERRPSLPVSGAGESLHGVRTRIEIEERVETPLQWIAARRQHLSRTVEEIRQAEEAIHPGTDVLALLSEEHFLELRRQFQELGKPGLSSDEFFDMMYDLVTRSLRRDLSATEVDHVEQSLRELFQAMDANGNGFVSDKELQWHLIHAYVPSQEQLHVDILPYRQNHLAQLEGPMLQHGSQIQYVAALDNYVGIHHHSQTSASLSFFDPTTSTPHAPYFALQQTYPIFAAQYVPESRTVVTSMANNRLVFYKYNKPRKADADEIVVLPVLDQLRYVWLQLPLLHLLWDDEINLLFGSNRAGELLAYSLDDGMSILKPPAFVLPIHRNAINTILSLPGANPKRVATADMDGVVKLTDVVRGKVMHEFGNVGTDRLHRKGVYSVDYSPRYGFLVTAGYEFEPLLWMPVQLKQQYVAKLSDTDRPHKHPLLGVKCIPNTPQVITGDTSGMFKVWDIRMALVVQTFDLDEELDPEQRPHLRALAFDVDTNRSSIISYTSRTDIHVSKLVVHGPQHRLTTNPRVAHDSTIIQVVYDYQTNSFLSCAAADVKVWNAHSGSILGNFRNVAPDPVTALALDDLGRQFFVGTHTGAVQAHSIGTGTVTARFVPHSKEVCFAKFDQSDRMLITASLDGSVHFYPCQSTTHASHIIEPESVLRFSRPSVSTAYSPNLGILLVGDTAGTVLVYDKLPCFLFRCAPSAPLGPTAALPNTHRERLALAANGPEEALGSSMRSESARPQTGPDAAQYGLPGLDPSAPSQDFGNLTVAEMNYATEAQVEYYTNPSTPTSSSMTFLGPHPAFAVADTSSQFTIWSVRPAPYMALLRWRCFTPKGATLKCIVTGMDWLPTNSSLYAGDDQGYLSVWLLQETLSHAFRHREAAETHQGFVVPPHPTLQYCWKAHLGAPITGVRVVSNSNAVVTASSDCNIYIWSLIGEFLGALEQGREKGFLRQHRAYMFHPGPSLSRTRNPHSLSLRGRTLQRASSALMKAREKKEKESDSEEEMEEPAPLSWISRMDVSQHEFRDPVTPISPSSDTRLQSFLRNSESEIGTPLRQIGSDLQAQSTIAIDINPPVEQRKVVTIAALPGADGENHKKTLASWQSIRAESMKVFFRATDDEEVREKDAEAAFYTDYTTQYERHTREDRPPSPPPPPPTPSGVRKHAPTHLVAYQNTEPQVLSRSQLRVQPEAEPRPPAMVKRNPEKGADEPELPDEALVGVADAFGSMQNKQMHFTAGEALRGAAKKIRDLLESKLGSSDQWDHRRGYRLQRQQPEALFPPNIPAALAALPASAVAVDQLNEDYRPPRNALIAAAVDEFEPWTVTHSAVWLHNFRYFSHIFDPGDHSKPQPPKIKFYPYTAPTEAPVEEVEVQPVPVLPPVSIEQLLVPSIRTSSAPASRSVTPAKSRTKDRPVTPQPGKCVRELLEASPQWPLQPSPYLSLTGPPPLSLPTPPKWIVPPIDLAQLDDEAALPLSFQPIQGAPESAKPPEEDALSRTTSNTSSTAKSGSTDPPFLEAVLPLRALNIAPQQSTEGASLQKSPVHTVQFNTETHAQERTRPVSRGTLHRGRATARSDVSSTSSVELTPAPLHTDSSREDESGRSRSVTTGTRSIGSASTERRELWLPRWHKPPRPATASLVPPNVNESELLRIAQPGSPKAEPISTVPAPKVTGTSGPFLPRPTTAAARNAVLDSGSPSGNRATSAPPRFTNEDFQPPREISPASPGLEDGQAWRDLRAGRSSSGVRVKFTSAGKKRAETPQPSLLLRGSRELNATASNVQGEEAEEVLRDRPAAGSEKPKRAQVRFAPSPLTTIDLIQQQALERSRMHYDAETLRRQSLAGRTALPTLTITRPSTTALPEGQHSCQPQTSNVPSSGEDEDTTKHVQNVSKTRGLLQSRKNLTRMAKYRSLRWA